jgi:hypothetical protein
MVMAMPRIVGLQAPAGHFAALRKILTLLLARHFIRRKQKQAFFSR